MIVVNPIQWRSINKARVSKKYLKPKGRHLQLGSLNFKKSCLDLELISVSFGFPLESLQRFSSVQTSVRLSAYQEHLPISRPVCAPSSQKDTLTVTQQSHQPAKMHFLSHSLAAFKPRLLSCHKVRVWLNWAVVYQSNCSLFSYPVVL